MVILNLVQHSTQETLSLQRNTTSFSVLVSEGVLIFSLRSSLISSLEVGFGEDELLLIYP